MEGVPVVGNSQCSVAFREQYSLQVSLEHGQLSFSTKLSHLFFRTDPTDSPGCLTSELIRFSCFFHF